MQPLSQNRPMTSAAAPSKALGQLPMQVEMRPSREDHWTRPPKFLPLKEMPLESYEAIEADYGDNTERICGDHENLIKVILEEEESLISRHRQHIDDIVDIIKQDMGLLQNVEEPQSDIEEYVD